ncbi:hypothetical protein [Saccharopolyspora sp. NPDC002376]
MSLRADHDVVIGADGIRSGVRQALFGVVDRARRGHCGDVGLVDRRLRRSVATEFLVFVRLG